MISIFLLLGIALLIQLAFFIPAFLFKTDKVTDLSYGLTFIILAATALIVNQATFAKVLLLIMIAVWAARLIIYLLVRIVKIKKDKRFDTIRENTGKFLLFWIAQGIIVWAVLLPTLLYLNTDSPRITLLSLIGLVVWATGLAIETIADCQKYSFKNNPKNKGKWIQTGLRKYTRHPNYFGEILVWIGVYLYTVSAFSVLAALGALLSPLVIIFILLFVTGIPTLERRYNRMYAKNSAYQAYKRRTSLLIPFPREQKPLKTSNLDYLYEQHESAMGVRRTAVHGREGLRR